MIWQRYRFTDSGYCFNFLNTTVSLSSRGIAGSKTNVTDAFNALTMEFSVSAKRCVSDTTEDLTRLNLSCR